MADGPQPIAKTLFSFHKSWHSLLGEGNGLDEAAEQRAPILVGGQAGEDGRVGVEAIVQFGQVQHVVLVVEDRRRQPVVKRSVKT